MKTLWQARTSVDDKVKDHSNVRILPYKLVNFMKQVKIKKEGNILCFEEKI